MTAIFATVSSDTLTVFGVITGAVAIVLALFTIWESWTFYRSSEDAAKRGEDAANNIRLSVERLESSFHRLYHDTFGMMRDTVTDMRRHVWGEQLNNEATDAVEAGADEKFEALRRELRTELRNGLEQVSRDVSEDRTLIEELNARTRDVLDRAIAVTRQTEDEVQRQRASVASGDMQSGILTLLYSRKSMSFSDLQETLHVPLRVIEIAVLQLRQEGLVEVLGTGSKELRDVRLTSNGSAAVGRRLD